MSLRFHPGLKKDDFFLLHPSLIEVTAYFLDYVLGKYQVRPTITSMIRPKKSDSGVHETGRALDLSRHEHDFDIKKVNAYKIVRSIPEEECNRIVRMMNSIYVRDDDLTTIMWHDAGFGWHFHIQVPFEPVFQEQELKNINLAKSRAVV